MLSNEMIPMDREVAEQGFLNAIENVDWVIKDLSVKQPTRFVNLIKRGPYALGTGTVHTIQRFHGHIGDQSGATFWSAIRTVQAATNELPAVDPCDPPNARMIGHAFERKNYYGYETALRTPDICLNAIKYTTEFRQQVSLIYKHLSAISMQTWENIGREAYMHFGRKMVCSSGSPDGATFTYNPFTSTQITVPSTTRIGALNWKWLRWWHLYMSTQNRASASAMISGIPVWPLIVDPVDVDDMAYRDTTMREDMRYGSPQVLLNNYMALDTIRKMFAMDYDMFSPHFKEVSNAGGTRTLERVNPFAYETTTIGQKPKLSAEYLNAQYGLAIMFLKDVFSFEVPPAIASLGGGTNFGVVPNLMGTFSWMNIQNETTNRYKETGHYDARYNTWLKPGDFSDEAVVILYKRCVSSPLELCTPVDTEGTGAIANVGAAAKVGTATNHTQVTVKLASILPCQANASVTVKYGAQLGTSATASIASDVDAPTYTLTFATAANWESLLASAFTVECA